MLMIDIIDQIAQDFFLVALAMGVEPLRSVDWIVFLVDLSSRGELYGSN